MITVVLRYGTEDLIRPQPLTLNQVLTKHKFKIAHVLCLAIASQVMRVRLMPCQAKVCMPHFAICFRFVSFDVILQLQMGQPGRDKRSGWRTLLPSY